MIFLLAGNREQATHWARKNKLPLNGWRYLSGSEQIRGWWEPVVWRLGTWYLRADLGKIELALLSRKAQVFDAPEAIKSFSTLRCNGQAPLDG